MTSDDIFAQIGEQFSQGVRDHLERIEMPDPVRWIEKNFYIPETKNDPILRGRFRLQDYQRDVIREALAMDENGKFKYSIIVWSDIKKSAKSTIAAAINLFRATYADWGEFYVVANDLKQANSRVNYYLKRAVLMNPKLAGKYKTVGYRTEAPSGSYIEAIPIDPSGEAGSNADQVTFCLDQETEVLTRDGWKGWETLAMDDEVATRSTEGIFEWQSPNDIYCAHYDGKMYQISSRTLSALVTPDHRMYGKFVGGRGIASGVIGNWKHSFVDELENRFLRAEEAAQTAGYYPVSTSEWHGGVSQNFIIPPTFARVGKGGGVKWVERQTEKIVSPELWAEFMGWYLSEGCVIKKRGSYEGISIGQSKSKNPENYKRIGELLTEMGLTPRYWSDGMSVVVYHSKLGEMLESLGLSGDKYIPEEIKNLPKIYLEIFLKAYIEGDGCRNGKYGYTIGTKSRVLRDDLVEVAQKCGWAVSSYERPDKRWRGTPIIFYVYLKSKDAFKRQKVEKRNWSVVDYKGMVFCPSTSNGVIYVRRQGTYYWTGNSELWGANEDAKQTMWAEMTISPTKHGKSFRWVESYAGFQEESELLYTLYDLGVHRGRMLWPDKKYEVTDGSPTPLELFVNPDARMLCLWNTQPRCPWQTKEYYSSEESVLTPNQFLRMHRNQWVTSTETFVPMEWWDACGRGSKEWPEIDRSRQPMVIALDAAVSDDTFGLWMGCRHPQSPTEVLTEYVQRWKPVQGHKVDFVGTEEKPGPELVIRKLIKDYNVVQVAYDPYQLHDMATRLKQEGLAWFREFPQGSDRLESDSQFRALIRDKRFWHRGEVDFREHVQNANAKVDDQDRRLRIVKRMEKLKIDLAVAASMGSYTVLYLNL